MTQSFKFTDRQIEARKEISKFQFFMLFGGSRSGKTFLAVYATIIRALKSSGSRHAILRFRFNAVKASIIFDTFPKVMQVCFPGVKYELSKSDWIVRFPNRSEVWFGGLDDKERTEKILGQEFATVYLNECSQISWGAVGMVKTRLAQNCKQDDGPPLELRMLFDCNPPDKNHWTYKVFVQGVDPDTRTPLNDKDAHGSIQMNPRDNMGNLPPSYLQTLENLPAHLRRRFLDGEFKDSNPNAIFAETAIDKWRVEDSSELPQMARIVIGVDPSGADDDANEGHDAIGIYVAGLGMDGNAYLIEDATVKAGPSTWGKMAVSAYHRHGADVMVGEQNYGGAMVKFVIQAADRSVNYRIVTASKGKVQRAEPFSPLFEDGRIRVVGRQNNLEEELGGFSTHGYTGANPLMLLTRHSGRWLNCFLPLSVIVKGRKLK
jgi:PBSX family phage terminase large subunit